MRFVGYFAALAAAMFGATASAQDAPSYLTSALWLMKPAAVAATEGEPELRTGRVNAFLFEQDLTAAAEAVLGARVELEVMPATRWSRSPATIVFEQGDGLVMVGSVGGRILFCDRRISWESRNWLDGRKLRACLLDTNRDGVFERVMWAGAGEGLFTPMFMLGGAPGLTVNVPYTPRIEGNPRLITAGPVVSRSPLGAYRVAFAVEHRGEPQALDDLGHRGGEARPDASGDDFDASGLFFRAEDAPVRVDVFGARIEIVSVDGETVSYRVHEHFNSERPMQIGYSGSMGHDGEAPQAESPAPEE